VAGTDHPDGDLSPIRNENLLEHLDPCNAQDCTKVERILYWTNA
jgi:hypothetical protein